MPTDDLKKMFGLDSWPADFSANFNVAPTQEVFVVFGDPSRRIEKFRWGLVPFWAKDEKIGNRLINARAETIDEKPSFRAAFKQRRCLIPTNGFYEWKKQGDKKQPYFCTLAGVEMFAFAGIWEQWRPRTKNPADAGEYLHSFSIITTTASRAFAGIHHRMPVILPPGVFNTWLSPKYQDPAMLKGLMARYQIGDIRTVPVSHRVNSPKHNDEANMAPLKT